MRLRAVYEVPLLAHATMEPMNCTAAVKADRCEIWAPTQVQTRSLQTAAKITGLPPGKITIHTTLLGGGFGRRLETDYVAEAVEISKAVGAPVKVLWTREDDIQHDFYRPPAYNVLEAGLDRTGTLLAWTHRIVGPSISARWNQEATGPLRAAIRRIIRPPQRGIDSDAVDVAAALPYAIPHIGVDYIMQDVGVPVGFWRSVGGSQNGFVVESFIDEVAAAAGQDPFQFRRTLLVHSPRHRAVLERAAAKAGWGTPAPPGIHRGIAVAAQRGAYVAEVAEVSVDAHGAVRVHRIVAVLDCGTVVNPNTVVAQMEGGVVFGLSAALKEVITISDGAVVQHNFHDYPVLRMNEVPLIEAEIMPSRFPPGGVGETATPPVAPAVANAIFAATGKRVRTLPILSLAR
jgi:CO/xanthine dehydrogenase Mo-binding subunit